MVVVQHPAIEVLDNDFESVVTADLVVQRDGSRLAKSGEYSHAQ